MSSTSQFGNKSVQLFKWGATKTVHPRVMLLELVTLLYYLFFNLTITDDGLQELIGVGILVGGGFFLFYVMLIWFFRKHPIFKRIVHWFESFISLGTIVLLFSYAFSTLSGQSNELLQTVMLFPAWFLIYFLVTDKELSLSDPDQSPKLLRNLVQKQQAVAIYPTKSEEGIDYQLVDKLPKRRLESEQEDENALNKDIPLQQIPFLIIQQRIGKANQGAYYTVPSSFSISQLGGTIRLHEANFFESKLASLSNIFIMKLFSSFDKQSSIWRQVNPNYLLHHPSASDFPFKDGLIVHEWTFQELQDVANKILNTMKEENRGLNSPILKSMHYAEENLNNNPIEIKRIKMLLQLLDLKLPEEKEDFWISMLNGFCIGNETKLLHGDIQLRKSKMAQINAINVLTKSEINHVIAKPVEEFIKVHDHITRLLKGSSEGFVLPEDLNTYLDSMTKQMLIALDATKYVERQILSGSIVSGKLVEEREGIIAGFTLSAKTTLRVLL